MRDIANKLAYFLGHSIKTLTIVTKNKTIIMNPKDTLINFEDDYLLLISRKEVRRIPYDEIKDIERRSAVIINGQMYHMLRRN